MEEYQLPFFKEEGYVRKKCPRCGDFFWTQKKDQELCGEANAYGCAEYRFISRPPTRRSYTLREMREAFLSFFEKRGHRRIKPYPVVARWRDDLFFTHASIVDFQPYVTNGEIPPPANPLVISQPCLRFVDIDNVGPTFGRHLTIFEMGGHHAFNYPDKEVYWKDQTVRYHHEFVTQELGVDSEEVIYKEGVWSGGGNAGPCVESIVMGLELATLVFMKFKVVGEELVELPIRTVDTGYGIERYTWLSQGTPSCFQAVYGPLLDKVMREAGVPSPDYKVLSRLGELSGLLSLERESVRLEARRRVAAEMGMELTDLEEVLKPIEKVFTVTDHTKSLIFMLAEGIVPSNMREGYLARLIIRRTYRLLRELSIEDKVLDIVDWQIDFWSKDFPHLRDMRNEIMEMLKVEVDKFKETLRRGESLIRRIAKSLKASGHSQFPKDRLIELYDSHGLTPEIVKEISSKEGLEVEIPQDFYTSVAERHIQASKTVEAEAKIPVEIEGLPETKRLYYDDRYLREFEAKVLKVIDGKYVVLDATAFYPEGGGQPPDRGILEFNGGKSYVRDVQTVGKVILHRIEGDIPPVGSKVKGRLDWSYRHNLMRSHTATHIIIGAARRVLGEHAWQSGAQKGERISRLDITHFRRLTLDEIRKIERLANDVVIKNLPVETIWLPREEAERIYGFRLYQGGVVPGRVIRVVKIDGWDVEACGGTHCERTGEIGLIKIVHTERIQDGVERIIFSVGEHALEVTQESEAKIREVADILGVPSERIVESSRTLVEENRELKRRVKQLENEMARSKATEYVKSARTIRNVRAFLRTFTDVKADFLIKIANEAVKIDSNLILVFISVNRSARVIVRVGEEALKQGLDARIIADETASVLGGRGSGRPTFAQGGGTLIDKVDEALKKAEDIIVKSVEGV